MSTTTKTTTVDKSPKAIVETIKKVVKRMKRENPTSLKLRNGEEFTLNSDLLDRFVGDDFKESDWSMLAGLLICKRLPRFDLICGKDDSMSLKLTAGQRQFRIRSADNSSGSAHASWYIQMFESTNPKVTMYTVRELQLIGHEDIEDLEWLLGPDTWKLPIVIHQETSFSGDDPEPFQDAILFDMLLDLAINDFKPHTRKIEDGPTIMLEILEALEKIQKEAEATTSSDSKKRRLTIQERLDGKRMKRE